MATVARSHPVTSEPTSAHRKQATPPAITFWVVVGTWQARQHMAAGRTRASTAKAVEYLIFLQVVWVAIFVGVAISSRPQVPCLFIFGDSLVDNGNNNRILTLARANYMPYGIDFPAGVTGRFSNGLTAVDVLAKLLGFSDYVPAHGDHSPMDQQIESFRRTVPRMRRYLGGNANRVNRYLSRCIFSVGMGSNDYLNNYFMPYLYSTSYEYSPKTYADVLLEEYSRQLTELYDLGARKVAVWGVGQIGCIPYEIARLRGNDDGSGGRCNERINRAIARFNKGLKKLVRRFNDGQLPGANFVYINTYRSFHDLAQNADSYGFEVVDEGCCGVGRNNGQITCLPLQPPCDDRSKYIFWDAFHPTEAANIILANKSYSSNSPSDVYPINIRQLAMS
ncbi:hypothetical protein ACLOJK_014219 [Asimina triloba]